MKVNLWIFLFLTCCEVFATTYNISTPGGLDTIRSSLQAGDTVFVAPGTYNERLRIYATYGTAESPIVFIGHGVFLDGTNLGLDQGRGVLHINTSDYVVVDGFSVSNAEGEGIYASYVDHITIKNNYTYNTVNSGIGVWHSSNVRVENNEVELANNDGDQECITVATTDTFEIVHNEVHHSGPGTNGGEGIDAKQSRVGVIAWNYVHHTNRLGIYVDSWDRLSGEILVYGNLVHDADSYGFAVAAENGGLLKNVKLFSNIAWRNKYSGVSVAGWGEEGAAHTMEDISICQNTFVGNGNGGWGGGISLENPDVTGLYICQNILADNGSFQIQVEPEDLPADMILEDNLIWGDISYYVELEDDSHIYGNPLFADTAQMNFTLLEGSAAIGKGTLLDWASVDYNGLTRGDDAVDLGAVEYREGNTSIVDGHSKGRQNLKAQWQSLVSNSSGGCLVRSAEQLQNRPPQRAFKLTGHSAGVEGGRASGVWWLPECKQ